MRVNKEPRIQLIAIEIFLPKKKAFLIDRKKKPE